MRSGKARYRYAHGRTADVIEPHRVTKSYTGWIPAMFATYAKFEIFFDASAPFNRYLHQRPYAFAVYSPEWVVHKYP